MINTTTLTSCSKCECNFIPGEIIYYTWTEKWALCVECYVKTKHITKEWEPKLVPEEGANNG